MRKSQKFKAALMLGVMAALSRQSQDPVKEGADLLLSPMSFEDKQRAKGLKPFIDPESKQTVWAINLKNAEKKFKKLRS